jgi:hypothetical protein
MTRSTEQLQVSSRRLVCRHLARVGQVITAVVSCGCGAVGVLAFPAAAFIAWLALGAMIGGFVLILCHEQARSRYTPGNAVVLATAGAAVTVYTCLVLAGLFVVLGALAATVIPLLVIGIGAGVWRQRNARGVDLDDPAPDGRAAPAVPTTIVPTTADASTLELCAQWRRSYWLLLDMPSGSDRAQVMQVRANLLDELERRDPAGFDRWLQTQPRAGSDPGRFLSTDH